MWLQYFPSIQFLYDSKIAKFEGLFYSVLQITLQSILYALIAETNAKNDSRRGKNWNVEAWGE